MPNAIYLSPHLDDAVYSCGGLMAQQVRQGQSVTVLSVFAGNPPPGPVSDYAQELHDRWGGEEGLMETRREEDLAACARLGAAAVHIAVPEAIYRKVATGRFLYASEEDIFGDPEPDDEVLVEQLVEVFDEVSPAGAYLYSPLGVGGHVDHLLTRRAAGRLERPVWYYHDFPYAARALELPDSFGPPQGVGTVLPLDEVEIESWAQAIWLYRSQRSTFWPEIRHLRAELKDYLGQHSGLPVFAPARRRKVE